MNVLCLFEYSQIVASCLFVVENPLKMVKSIREDTDLTCVLPVKKIQG